MKNIVVIRDYVVGKESEIDLNNYYKTFSSANILMNAKSSDVTFSKKVGALSIKCAFNGREIYETQNGSHAVDDNSYLILNSGQEYSGYIKSETEVESFSVFFNNEMVNDVLGAMITPADKLLDDYLNIKIRPIEFIEKSYDHDSILTPYLIRIKNYLKSNTIDTLYLEEQFHFLLEELYNVHQKVKMEIELLPFKKLSTSYEIYKRLNKAKDMMDVIFNTIVSLKKISSEACLCTHHFLRLFKKVFGITPYQYLTRKRLQFAKFNLLRTEIPISVISDSIGFQNLSSFTRLFKNHYSMSPTAFRESRRRKKSILVKQ